MKVIITGASKGIGRGIATFLAKEGFAVGLIARSEELLITLKDEIDNSGGTCEIESVDLADFNDTQKAIKSLHEKLGGLDAIINNAGLVIRKDALSISLGEWHDMINLNINGLFYATRSALPFFVNQQSGHIINISSISGHTPLPGGSGYAATKYAVTGFSQSLFHEVRDHGIKVSVIFPGSVDSASHRHDPDESTDWKVQPEEVGKACYDVLNTAPGNCIHQLEIRPLRKASKK